MGTHHDCRKDNRLQCLCEQRARKNERLQPQIAIWNRDTVKCVSKYRKKIFRIFLKCEELLFAFFYCLREMTKDIIHLELISKNDANVTGITRACQSKSADKLNV